jgi:hypothetical protein
VHIDSNPTPLPGSNKLVAWNCKSIKLCLSPLWILESTCSHLITTKASYNYNIKLGIPKQKTMGFFKNFFKVPHQAEGSSLPAILMGAFVAFGGILFGYDTGTIRGILAMGRFLHP